jgi:hypothetical protein
VKNHVTISGQGSVLIHGGETFDGKSREPIGDIYIMTMKPSISFFKVGVSDNMIFPSWWIFFEWF